MMNRVAELRRERNMRQEEPAAAETVQVVLGDAEEWSR